MKNTIANMVQKGIFAFAALALLVLPLSPVIVNAADLPSGHSYSYSYPTPSAGSSYSYSYPSSGSSYSYSYPSSGSSYSYSYPSSGGCSSCGGSSYSYSYPNTTNNSGYSYSYSYPNSNSNATASASASAHASASSYSFGGYSYKPKPPAPKPAPICVLTVSPTSITQGQTVIVSWTSTNATSGSITGMGSVALNGSQTATPNTSTTYTGTFSGPGGTVTCSGSVGVLPTPPAAPSCVLTLSKTHMTYGYEYQNQGITLSWSSTNSSYGIINNGIGNVSPSGSRTVYPNTSTTYTGTFYGANGQTTICSATITVAVLPPPPTTPYVTLSAVPYTGLELGPAGTALYWSFLIAWCLFAAYLVVVKRVHMQIYNWYSKVLFGTTSDAVTVVTPVVATSTPVIYSAPVAIVTNDAIDPFIFAQVNRNRRS